MYGAMIGDFARSYFEFHNMKKKDVMLNTIFAQFTDDTFLTIAIADALLEHRDKIDNPAFDEELKALFVKKLKQYGRNFKSSYGDRFREWLYSENSEPYNSFGNGSAMRVSPAAWVSDDQERVRTLARLSAEKIGGIER